MVNYTSLADANVTGLSGIFVYVSNQVPIFIPILLLCVFGIAMMGTYYANIRSRGYSNFWGCFAIAGFITTIISIIMSLVPNLINTTYVVICIVISIIGVGILLAQGNDD